MWLLLSIFVWMAILFIKVKDISVTDSAFYFSNKKTLWSKVFKFYYVSLGLSTGVLFIIYRKNYKNRLVINPIPYGDKIPTRNKIIGMKEAYDEKTHRKKKLKKRKFFFGMVVKYV